MRRRTCDVNNCGTHRWPVRDLDRAHVTAEVVVPEPGQVLGAVLRYEHPDGRRSAAVAEYVDGMWASLTQPLPEDPPPAWAGAVEAARKFIDGGVQ